MLAPGPSLRLLPRLDDTNRFFWTSGRDGVLRFLTCQSCRRLVHPPGPRCPYCLSADLLPEPVSGRATVASVTVNHQQWIPGSDPYAIALVVIEEQDDVRLMTNLVGVDDADGAIGTTVEVTFERQDHDDEVFLPLFRPLSGGGTGA